MTLGAGPGIGDELGTPDVQAFLDVAYTPAGLESDDDGIPDSVDRCPQLDEDFDGFEDADGCPDNDNDGDGIVDANDQCSMAAEDNDGFEDADGCPDNDNDGDGIVDVGDTCPGQAEDRDGHQDADGCPDNDNDGDGIVDAIDKCPAVAETLNGFRDDDGCADERPKYVFEKDAPVILYSVEFKTNSAELREESHAVLDEVVASLKAQPDVRVRVEGHTDDRGKDSYNLTLSQQRALSVVNYLASKGVDRERLEYEGYGETRPQLEGTTAEARARNRRVEFQVIP